MIKINLLGSAPPPRKIPMVGGPAAQKATLVMMFVGGVVVAFGTVGIIYKIWSNQIADLEKQRSQQKIRQTELAVVKAQNDKYQQRLRDLETRINTIQALQNSRVGPVELMTSLGNVVSKTNDLYLYTVTPEGERVQLKGQAGTVNTMANFMAFLKNSGSFDDVQLEQFYQDDLESRLTYKFTLSCQFKLSNGGASPTAGESPAFPTGPAAAPDKASSAPGTPVSTPAPVPQGAKRSM